VDFLMSGPQIKTASGESKPPSRAELASRLQPHGQQHLLQFWDELDDAGRCSLARQIAAIDLQQMQALYAQTAAAADWAALARRAEPPPAVRLADRQRGRFTAQEARDRGARALAAGEIGILLTAGGQGSRLGFDQPKGLYPIGPVSHASLLQIHLEKALAVARRYGAAVPVYMMTSPVTHDEQTAFLDEHHRFGLAEDDLVVFCQGTMPAVDAHSGKLLMAAKDELFLSPNGHGGTVAALADSGAIRHMHRRGVKHLFYLQVDNPMTPIADAEFLGYHLLVDSELTSMAVSKETPHERIGNFVAVDGRVQVIEYSDFPNDVAELRNPDGSLKFWAGSIAIHAFAVAFLERALALGDALPFHVARKKVSHVDDQGRLVEPKEPNALKFERFIFDLLPHADNALVVEYPEHEVFAPLKNASGAVKDTPEYVREHMLDQHRGWLEQAGVRIAPEVPVEISPLWALDAAGVADRPDLPPSIDQPTYLREL
jgi:UDP-N-acetylglucosamine/UDP-N-acetylgalactosamine diphosphorylase